MCHFAEIKFPSELLPTKADQVLNDACPRVGRVHGHVRGDDHTAKRDDDAFEAHARCEHGGKPDLNVDRIEMRRGVPCNGPRHEDPR